MSRAVSQYSLGKIIKKQQRKTYCHFNCSYLFIFQLLHFPSVESSLILLFQGSHKLDETHSNAISLPASLNFLVLRAYLHVLFYYSVVSNLSLISHLISPVPRSDCIPYYVLCLKINIHLIHTFSTESISYDYRTTNENRQGHWCG